MKESSLALSWECLEGRPLATAPHVERGAPVSLGRGFEEAMGPWVGTRGEGPLPARPDRHASPVPRDRGPAGVGHLWTGFQPVEEQGVCLPQLQPQHCRLPFCSPSGEVPGNGSEQQSNRQPPVRASPPAKTRAARLLQPVPWCSPPGAFVGHRGWVMLGPRCSTIPVKSGAERWQP